MDELKRGQREILDAKLEVFANINAHRNYLITIADPEFSCLCPRTGYPDFATIELKYVPDKWCIELKSYKLYINKFRDRGIFHEEVVNEILDDLVRLCQPRFLGIRGDFNPRGNIHTVVTVQHFAPGFDKKTLDSCL